MNKQRFIEEVQKLGINLSEKNLNDLSVYQSMLVEYNELFNLTAITKEEDIYLKHFYDSLTLVKAIDFNDNLKVLDIGTGAGFPGLVLKIIFSNLNMTLVDANNKKIGFLEAVIKKLNLTNITCIHARCEELDLKEEFDVITSRAVAHLRILLELSIPYLKVGGYFLPMKGNGQKEIEESLSTLKVLNSEIEEEIKFNLPIEESERTILKIKKIDVTPSIYPRKYDKIKKKILK